MMDMNQAPEPPPLPPKPAGGLSNTSEINLLSKGSMGGSRKLTCLFPFSGSIQDLRCFDVENNEKDEESSPRGVLEASTNGLATQPPSPIAQSSVSENHTSNPRPPHHGNKFWKLWKGPKLGRLPSFPPLGMHRMSKRKTIGTTEHVENLCPMKSNWKNFTLSELRSASKNFSQENFIGKGGYAEVYKGRLPNGKLVAIKRLNRGTSEDKIISFLSEIGIIAHVNHPNTAKMIGYGVEGGTFLVLQLSSLGSLGSLLRGSKENLIWGIRYKIILGTANGLLYLHENCQRRIIHRDIKADNILLTEDYEPQICDFGLAKWLPNQWTHHNVSKFEGTFGYFAPEYFMHGIVDEKTDVFSFGVLLLEIITGRQALSDDESQTCLVLWAKPLLKSNNLRELVDPSLGNYYIAEELERVALAASMCIEDNPILRPRMSLVVKVLRGGNDDDSKFSIEHRKRFLQRTYSEELLDVEEYNSTKHLNELSQKLKEIVGSPSSLSSSSNS